MSYIPGCGSVWLERLVRDQEAGGSNPLTPTIKISDFQNMKAAIFIMVILGEVNQPLAAADHPLPAVNHPSYTEELDRVNATLEYVDKSLDSTTKRKETLDRNVESTKKHFNTESSQNYIDLMVNSILQGSAGLKLRNLVAAKSKPYFSRVDFKEAGKDKAEKLYIGKMALMRDEDQEMVIIDWRAPVANLYYEERLGDATYSCPDGVIKGKLQLKRQFTINSGILENIFDIDVTTIDELLQSSLGANAENRLKEIVSTIQAEQNHIIRADMWKPLIVQGAAGSGKTTIALHRIAYLIYTHRNSFKPENFMIIAPNKLFLNYISEVLPELGVEKVSQSTFEDFAAEIIGKKLRIRDQNEKIAVFVNNNITREQVRRNVLLKKTARLKASMLFKKVLDEYIAKVERSFIPREDFKLGSIVLYKYDEINKLFLEDYKTWPFLQRLDEIRKNLSNRLKTKKTAIVNQLYEEYELKLSELKLMEESDKRQKLIIDAINEKDEMIRNVETYAKKAVNSYIAKISKVSVMEYYKDFILNDDNYSRYMEGRAEKELVEFSRMHSADILKADFVELEDLAPVIYIKYRIFGKIEKIPVRHIVIDEAQDFSVFQIYVLRKIIKDSSFTILGDLSQGIHSYRGIRDWNDIIKYVFDDRDSELLILEQSYRTTVEVMEAANKVIGRSKNKNLVPAKPVIRHGEHVVVKSKNSIKEIAADIDVRLNELKDSGYKSAAIICKTLDECNSMFSYLKTNGEKPYVITGKEDKYRGGVVVIPSYLAKGLEFDVVLIANADAMNYQEDELDIKLLYVAMTRPLHRLYIYYSGEISPLIEGI